jgi:FdhD protein
MTIGDQKGIASRSVLRIGADTQEATSADELDAVVVEEPLEIRVAGEPLSVTMRTPGDDHRLTLGFLFAEGVIGSTADVGSLVHCGRPGEEGFGNVIDVSPGPGVVLEPEQLARTRRGTLTSAACGVCGRQTIEDLEARCAPVAEGPTLDLEVLRRCTDQLRSAQKNFDRTGGIHAAAALSADGTVLALAEDVGRHNAVDKVLGALLYEGIIGSAERSPSGSRASGGAKAPAILVVSGRTSFEMVQKAVVGRFAAVASVSAPTSLAVDLADRMGVTLAGFVRGGRINVYTHRSRIRAPAAIDRYSSNGG